MMGLFLKNMLWCVEVWLVSEEIDCSVFFFFFEVCLGLIFEYLMNDVM